MGIYDRDYTRDGRAPMQGPRGWSVTTKLIVVNVVLWFVYAASLRWGGPRGGLYTFISEQLLLHPDSSFRPWQPLTAMFLHNPTDIGHVFFNMLFLFFFGRVVEQLIGGRDYLKLYLLSGSIAALSLVPLAWVTGDPRPGLGASGAVYAIGVFAAMRVPNLLVILFIVPMPLWVMVSVFMVGKEVVSLLATGANVGATIAHLTGAAVGFLYHLYLRRRGPARAPSRSPSWLDRMRPKADVRPQRRDVPDEAKIRAQVDALLEKINSQGIASLSKEEKDFLQEASSRFQ